MTMIIVGKSSLAVIDPRKKFGENGQYVMHADTEQALAALAEKARLAGCELRWYYRGLVTGSGEPIASQQIMTEIPPGHIQPFHTHFSVHEMTLVISGLIVAVDSDTLTEDATHDELVAVGKLVESGQLIIEGPGTRHTIFNPGKTYAVLLTTQTARIPLEEFPNDWHRDKPNLS